jgi:quinol monooxygenase YgiN
MKSLRPIRPAVRRDAHRAIAVALAATLVGSGGSAAGVEPSAMHSYYYFLHWMSVSRPDLALEQFADDAVVVAGPSCTPAAPCVGKAAIRAGYFDALNTGRVPLPVNDQRFDGQRLRTRGEQIVVGDHLVRAGHVFEFRDGRIVSLKLLVGAPSAAADEPVTVIARYWVTPGREAEAEPRFRKALEFMQKVEPASSFRMYRAEKDPSLFVYVEVYPSQAALDEHRKVTNPARAKELGPTPEGLLARPPEIQEFRSVGHRAR